MLVVEAGEVLCRRAVGCELPETLAEAAAYVEELGAGLESREDGSVGGVLGDVDLQVEPAAEARVLVNCVGFVALWEWFVRWDGKLPRWVEDSEAKLTTVLT